MTENTKVKSKRIRKIFSIVFTIFLVYVAITLIFENVAFLNRYEHFVIVSDSMEPTINVGDVVIINNATEPDTLQSGDIIAFETTINDQLVTVVHYIHDIEISNDQRIFTTIAENADNPDVWSLNDDDITGTYVLRIPQIGRFLLFAQSPVGRMVIIIDIILIYLLYRMFFKRDKKEGEKG